MKQNSLYNIIAGGVLALSATACTGAYEDINRNPFEPDDLTADDYALSSSMYNICNTVMSNDVNQYQFVESLMGCTLGDTSPTATETSPPHSHATIQPMAGAECSWRQTRTQSSPHYTPTFR